MLNRSVCIAKEISFDDAGTGAITITLGDTPGIDRQNVCLEEGEFWHNDRLWASRPRTTVCELEDLLELFLCGLETVLVPEPGRCRTV